MQDTSRTSSVNSLPRLGNRLARLRGWESDFRQLAGLRSFSELNLPLSLPASEFVSRLSGEPILPNAPRFLDSNGTEWALRTDLTVFSAQFVCRHAAELKFPFKLFYSGKVFSPQGLLGAEGFRLGHASEFESLEFGAEIIGDETLSAEHQLLELAVTTLRKFGYTGITLSLGDARVIARLEEAVLQKICDNQARVRVKGQLRETILGKDFSRLSEFLKNFEIDSDSFWKDCLELQELNKIAQKIADEHAEIKVIIDPLLTRQRRFYSGLVFDFWGLDAQGFLKNVGGGGRYDKLLEHFGHTRAAVGFMLRDPQTTGVEDDFDGTQLNSSQVSVRQTSREGTGRPIRIALPKGRLQKWGLQAFSDVGIKITENTDTSRKLVLQSDCGNYEFLFVKNSDVVSYVERGIAEVAIAGSDLLDEADVSAILRPVTFSFGQCRICLAGRPEAETRLFAKPRPRIATKYPHLALQLLRDMGMEPELVPLQGSVELASVISFCDGIVDLVETGSTLRENGLIVFRELAQTRVQLITSRGYYAQFLGTLRHWLQHWRTCEHVVGHQFEIPRDEVAKNDSGSKFN